jgi:hypothetical protein
MFRNLTITRIAIFDEFQVHGIHIFLSAGNGHRKRGAWQSIHPFGDIFGFVK